MILTPELRHDLRAALGAVVLQIEVARMALARDDRALLARALDTALDKAMQASRRLDAPPEPG